MFNFGYLVIWFVYSLLQEIPNNCKNCKDNNLFVLFHYFCWLFKSCILLAKITIKNIFSSRKYYTAIKPAQK